MLNHHNSHLEKCWHLIEHKFLCTSVQVELRPYKSFREKRSWSKKKKTVLSQCYWCQILDQSNLKNVSLFQSTNQHEHTNRSCKHPCTGVGWAWAFELLMAAMRHLQCLEWWELWWFSISSCLNWTRLQPLAVVPPALSLFLFFLLKVDTLSCKMTP